MIEKIDQVILQTDVVDITPDLFQMLVTKGWEADALKLHMAHGARYSPSRNSVLLPPVSSEDEDLDSDEDSDSLGEQVRRA